MKDLFRSAFLAPLRWAAACGMSLAEAPTSPFEMAAEMEAWLAGGAGALYPVGFDGAAQEGSAAVVVDASWSEPFQARVGERVFVRISEETGDYEFFGDDGTVFWIEVPFAPATWNWIVPFRNANADNDLYAPTRLVRSWTLVSDEATSPSLRAPSRRTPLRTNATTAAVEHLVFTSFAATNDVISFSFAWPATNALPQNVADLYATTNLADATWFLLSSIPATNPPVSHSLPQSALPNHLAATPLHTPNCSIITNVVLSPLDGTTVYTNVVWDCDHEPRSVESAFFRLGTRHDSDGDGLSDAYERLVTHTDDQKADTDGDGLSDVDELDLGTDPLAADTDGDGLSDLREVGLVVPVDYRWVDTSSAPNLLATGGDEGGIWTTPIAAPFFADGVSHSHIAIDTNGIVFLLEPGGSVTNAHPAPQALATWDDNPAHLAVAALWCPLESDAESALRIVEAGTASIVEFDGFLLPASLPENGGESTRTASSRRVSFQIVLPHTVHDTLDVHYREIPEGGISVGAVVGVHNRDRGYFILPEGHCTLPRPGDSGIDPASGRGFRYHLGLGTNPLVADTDSDGLTDGAEVDGGTNPLAADTDGDGVSDADEQAAGTDPNDAADKVGYQSGAVLGNGARGVPVTFQQTFPISANASALVAIWVATEEYPEFTGSASEYDDMLVWTLSTNNVAVRSGVTNVNALHTQFVASSEAGHHVPGILADGPPVAIEWFFLSAPADDDLEVKLDFEVTNVADGQLPSTMMAALYPLRVVQANWPDSATATDFGVRRSKRIFRNGIAYVTGEPAAPALTACFQGLPDFVNVGWKLALVTERSEREIRDNRHIPEQGYSNLAGNVPWDIAAALDEIVGGTNIVSFQIANAVSGEFSHLIRGKNPQDADVVSYLESHLRQSFQRTGFPILRHETRQGRFVFNQFNARGRKAEIPNLGAPDGWGISQIDRSRSHQSASTAEVWNWKTNVDLVDGLLQEKFSDASRFISYFRTEYGQNEQWTEPLSEFSLTAFETVSLQPIEWSGAVLYNGADGVPSSAAGGHSFASPLVFSPEDGWLFYDNANEYAHHIAQEIVWRTNNAHVEE